MVPCALPHCDPLRWPEAGLIVLLRQLPSLLQSWPVLQVDRRRFLSQRWWSGHLHLTRRYASSS